MDGIRLMSVPSPLSDGEEDSTLISQAFVYIPVKRAFRYYLYSVAFPLFIITLSVCLAFLMSAEELADRLSVDLTLLLTAVAYKLYLGSCLPPVSYLTRLDVYTMASLVYLSAAMGAHGLTSVAPALDTLLACTFAASWLVYTAVFLRHCVAARDTEMDHVCRKLSAYTAEHGEVHRVTRGTDCPPRGKRATAQSSLVAAAQSGVARLAAIIRANRPGYTAHQEDDHTAN